MPSGDNNTVDGSTAFRVEWCMNLSSGNGGTFLNRLITKGEAGAEAWLAERNAADSSFWTFADTEETLKGLVAG